MRGDDISAGEAKLGVRLHFRLAAGKFAEAADLDIATIHIRRDVRDAHAKNNVARFMGNSGAGYGKCRDGGCK